MHEGDYFEEDREHHISGVLELDGTENWLLGEVSEEQKNQRFYLKILNAKDNSKVYCTHFKELHKGSLTQLKNDDSEQCNISNGKYLQIKIDKEVTRDIAHWKEFIANEHAKGTPVTVAYEMLDEEILPYTPEQQQAWEKIKQAHGYKNETNICSTDELEPNLDVTYRKDLETLQKQQNDRIKVIEEMLSTTATSALLLDNMQTDLESEVN